jgi:hypothetical protein
MLTGAVMSVLSSKLRELARLQEDRRTMITQAARWKATRKPAHTRTRPELPISRFGTCQYSDSTDGTPSSAARVIVTVTMIYITR